MSITLYEHADYKGRKLTLTESTPNLVRKRFNDIASSVVVAKGTWKLWEHVDYQGNSFIVTPGKYNIGEIHDKIGNDVISSVELCEEGEQLIIATYIVQGRPPFDCFFLLNIIIPT